MALKDVHSDLEPLASHRCVRGGVGWGRVGAVPQRVLCCSLQGGLSVVDQGIKRVLQLRKTSSRSSKLTDQDLFYREVGGVSGLVNEPLPYISAMLTVPGESC